MRPILTLVLVVAIAACKRDGDSNSGKDGPGTTAPGGVLDAGRVVLHRLNRTEYDNTVRDLLGTTLTPAIDTFPNDDMVAGFDNIASNLSISPLHVELYELAAQALADEVLVVPLDEPYTFRAEGEGSDVTTTTGGSSGEAWNLWSNGDLSATFVAPADGLYEITTRLWANQAGPDLASMTLGHDGYVDLTADVTASSTSDAQTFTVEVDLVAGPHTMVVSFNNDYYDSGSGADRNLYVDWIDVYGPTNATAGPNPLRDEIVTCDPAVMGDLACAEQVLEGLAFRAWRRPIASDEAARMSDLAAYILDDGGTFDDAVKWGIVAILTSPHFIYRVEIDPEPSTDRAFGLNDYELATRLSYFLWSSMPDATLFAAAANGELGTIEEIEAQVRRMIVDPKASALVDNFGGQWLFIRGIDEVAKDPVVYPQFDDALRASMKEEMNRFFETFVFEDRDMRELVTATEGEIDATLAAHYGIPFSGSTFQTVDLSAWERGGLLGQAGMLTINSNPARTSPVVRGKYVLGQLLCDEPPPPPPGVEGLDEDSAAETVREQLEQHRADPVCASCHEVMDEIGFALENFDALGQWRDEDRGFPIDSSGQLPDGTTFDSAQTLSVVLAADPRFTECMADQLFTYGLGRVLTPDDAPFLTEIYAQFAAGAYTFDDLAVAIATSSPFRMRRGEP